MQKKYEGFSITMDEYMRFVVSDTELGTEEHGDPKTYDTYAAATTYIDGVIKRRNAVKKRSLKLPVFYRPNPGRTGNQILERPIKAVTIKGYHAKHGTILLNEESLSTGYGTPDVYVDHPYVREAMARFEAADKARVAALAELKKYEIKQSYDATKGPERYEAAIVALEQKHAELTKLADEAQLHETLTQQK